MKTSLNMVGFVMEKFALKLEISLHVTFSGLYIIYIMSCELCGIIWMLYNVM